MFEAGAHLSDLHKINGDFLTVQGVMLDEIQTLWPECYNVSGFLQIWLTIRDKSQLFTRRASRSVAFIRTVSASNFCIDLNLTQEEELFDQRFLRTTEQRKVPDWRSRDEERAQTIASIVAAATGRRTFALSKEHGIMGLVPYTTLEGDLCCIIAQCSVPLILRPTFRGSRRYKVIGEAYLYGFMFGEVAQDIADGKHQVTELTLC